jgi:hypothetical protein
MKFGTMIYFICILLLSIFFSRYFIPSSFFQSKFWPAMFYSVYNLSLRDFFSLAEFFNLDFAPLVKKVGLPLKAFKAFKCLKLKMARGSHLTFTTAVLKLGGTWAALGGKRTVKFSLITFDLESANNSRLRTTVLVGLPIACDHDPMIPLSHAHWSSTVVNFWTLVHLSTRRAFKR